MADALAIVGPTASGKTGIAIRVAARLGGVVISLDSRQVYRAMDIGTAKPALDERGGVPHLGFDLIEPGERYSAGRFVRAAWPWIDDIRARARVPILAGGTGFFLRALIQPLFDEPDAPTARREAIKSYLAEFDDGRLRAWAAALDPAGRWDAPDRTGGRQRAARAIEVVLLTGRSLGWWHARPVTQRRLDAMTVVLDLPRDVLYERIDRRVDAMLEAGLEAEVRALLAAGHHPYEPGMDATGYREMAAFVRGECTLEEAADTIRRATRRYARRQITWFRHQLPSGAHRIDANRPAEDVADEIVGMWRRTER